MSGQRFEMLDERIENETPYEGKEQPYFYYRLNEGKPVLNVLGASRALKYEEIDLDKSILAQRRDPDQYPEITYLAKCFSSMRLYRDWSFGRYTPPRLPQPADQENYHLDANGGNLGLVLNRLSRKPPVKDMIIRTLQSLYEGIVDFGVQIEEEPFRSFLERANTRFPPRGSRTERFATCVSSRYSAMTTRRPLSA